MKNLLLLLSFLSFLTFASYAQSADSRRNKVDEAYTGKRFDSYGKPLEKKRQNKKRKANKDDVFWGDASKKAYPIGMEKDKKKKRKKARKARKAKRGKKGKKSCDCPGH